MTSAKLSKPYQATGTQAPWYRGWDLTEEERHRFRLNSIASQAAKAKALRGECKRAKHPIPDPRLRAEDLMPVVGTHGLRALSMFSGGGGLDIGFERAGFDHVASYEIREDATAVLRKARPKWTVYGGEEGDVCGVSWARYVGKVDVLHGGPPCQPFSHAGHRSGPKDVRDMFPELVRAVQAIMPRVFIAENVAGLTTKRFAPYIQRTVLEPLGGKYIIRTFMLDASSFGVPQRRRRLWFIGFRRDKDAGNFLPPMPTHRIAERETPPLTGMQAHLLTMGARKALGLPDTGYDGLAPTLRSGFSGPRHTTSVVNSVSALREWQKLRIWPHGVAEDREKAAAFAAQNGHFRLSIPDCMLLQGFPSDWPLKGAVYRSLGLIGNSVSPPMAYQVALAVAHALAAR